MSDEIEYQLVKSLADLIIKHVQKSGLERDKALNISENLLFDLCCLLDGSASIDNEANSTVNKIVFVNEKSGIEYESTFSLHDYATGYYDDIRESSNKMLDVSGLVYKTGDSLIGIKILGRVSHNNIKKQNEVINSIKSALVPVLDQYSLNLEAMSLMGLSKIALSCVTCETCGTFDPSNPNGD